MKLTEYETRIVYSILDGLMKMPWDELNKHILNKHIGILQMEEMRPIWAKMKRELGLVQQDEEWGE